MADNQHFRDIIRALNAENAEYLVIGGYAVVKYSEPRYTKDLDLWVRPDLANAHKVYRALAAFGAPLQSHGVTAQDFTYPGTTLQIGEAPMRIDILTEVSGLHFSQVWPNRVPGMLAGERVDYISREDLIKNKEATGRRQDIQHLKYMSRKLPKFSRDE